VVFSVDLDNSVFVRLLDFWLSLDMDNWYSKSINQGGVLQFKVAELANKDAEPEKSLIVIQRVISDQTDIPDNQTQTSMWDFPVVPPSR
jgi:hypothetical protein